MLPKEEIGQLIAQHRSEPHLRLLQQRLAKEVTIMVHGEEEYQLAVEASQVLFGKGTKETLEKMSESTFLEVFDGVPQYSVSKDILQQSISLLDLLAVQTNILPSKSEARKLIAAGGVSINKEKINTEITVDTSFLISNKYILVQKGKKNYYLIIVD